MRRQLNVGDLAATGILTALALMIPIVFTFLRVTIPPFFTATLMSHVPSMLAMLMGPFAAVGVGLGSALGFTVFVGPAIGARALSHALFAWVGNWAWNRGMPLWLVMLIALPFHAVFEMGVVWALGGNLEMALITLVGTAIHHGVDGAFALGLVAALRRSGVRWFEPAAE
ncbi:MAG: hypothetical protein AB2385_02905 [Symbiobacterium sp.]|uniref:hypothetical protein n=1 Tax=Symbiobacterium sp. TaxID=1971213 RepID=UPI003463B1AC